MSKEENDNKRFIFIMDQRICKTTTILIPASLKPSIFVLMLSFFQSFFSLWAQTK